jgi:TolA-binding protein
MLKYINKQLSKDELHQVETHMLDCELCTDAYEGMAYAENSSMLFAIDSQIDRRVGAGVAKVPIMRNLMVAASILVLVFGTYFTVNFFNKTIKEEGSIALNEEVKSTQQIQLESIMSHGSGAVDLEDVELKNELNKQAEKELNPAPETEVAEQTIIRSQDKDFLEDDNESPMIVDSEAFSADELMDIEIEEEEISVVAESDRKDMLTESISETKYAEVVSPVEERSGAVKAKALTNDVLKKRSKNTRTRAVSSEPVPSGVKSESNNRNNLDQKILIIEDYKVVNYSKEYQEAYDDEKEMTPDLSGVSAGYANKLDKEVAEKAKEVSVIEVTYRETLEKAIHLYKIKKYSQAIGEFDVILAKHPEEVNAQFYSGLSFYHLGQNKVAIEKFNTVLKNKETEFNEETNWYKALGLINMKDITAAKNLLNEIIEKDGFYKVKAEEKLKGL